MTRRIFLAASAAILALIRPSKARASTWDRIRVTDGYYDGVRLYWYGIGFRDSREVAVLYDHTRPSGDRWIADDGRPKPGRWCPPLPMSGWKQGRAA